MLEFMGVVALGGFGICALGIGVGWLVGWYREREFRKFLKED